MHPRIIEITARKLVGMKIVTSLSENRTFELWNKFKRRTHEIQKRKSSDFYSVQVFENNLKSDGFSPVTLFEKWAAVEVSEFSEIPQGMECHTLAGGKYAVFILRGTFAEAIKTRQSVFERWLPNAEFQLDDREHFEIMGEKYIGPSDAGSEEELWLPVK